MDRFVNHQFVERYKATIGADFLTREVKVNTTLVTLQIWDTAGCERFNSLGSAFFRGADCCLLVFDVTNVKSFEDLTFWKEEFLLHASVDEKDKENFPFIVLGNKADLTDRAVTKEKAETWCKQHNCIYFETSAKTALNVEKAFQTAAGEVIKRQEHIVIGQRMPTKIVDMTKQPPNSKETSCC